MPTMIVACKIYSFICILLLLLLLLLFIIKFVTNVKTLQQYNTTVYDMCDRNKEQNFHPN
jgi:hypothetical protein